MEIRCIKGMQRLKLVSSENNSVFKGLKMIFSTKSEPLQKKRSGFYTSLC